MKFAIRRVSAGYRDDEDDPLPVDEAVREAWSLPERPSPKSGWEHPFPAMAGIRYTIELHTLDDLLDLVKRAGDSVMLERPDDLLEGSAELWRLRIVDDYLD